MMSVSKSTELELEPGQPIWHQDPQTKVWNTGSIVEQTKEPHSFIIEDTEGGKYRRNRNFLKPRQTSDSTGVESQLQLQQPLPEASASGPATSQSASLSPDRMQSPVSSRCSSRSTKGIQPKRLIEEN